MSLTRMTNKEKAFYYIGKAIVHRIKHSELTTDKSVEFLMVMNWLESWMTIPEARCVNEPSGLDFDNRPLQRFNTTEPVDIPFLSPTRCLPYVARCGALQRGDVFEACL